MNKHCIPIFFSLLLFILPLHAQKQSEKIFSGAGYDVELINDASIIIQLKNAKTYKLYPRFIIMQRQDDPGLRSQNAHTLVKNFKGAVSVPTWKNIAGDQVADFFQSADPVTVMATSAKCIGNQITWNFPANAAFTLNATLSILQSTKEPVIRFTFTPARPGWYSIGFAGMPETEPQETDAIWQPFIWQEKRFPEQSFLSSQDMCPLPAVMVEKEGTRSAWLPSLQIFPTNFLPQAREM